MHDCAIPRAHLLTDSTNDPKLMWVHWSLCGWCLFLLLLVLVVEQAHVCTGYFLPACLLHVVHYTRWHHTHAKSMVLYSYSLTPRPFPLSVRSPGNEDLVHYTVKVTGYSLLILFNCACAWTTLHGLWTDAISAVQCLYFEPKIASSIYESEET